jgi:hypothetical protein
MREAEIAREEVKLKPASSSVKNYGSGSYFLLFT